MRTLSLPPDYLLVITTCPTEEEATRLASSLIDKRLAACVQSSEIRSTYRWLGVIEHTSELRLMIKAKTADYAAIEAFIRSTHSYDNPEIIAIPVSAGSQSYFDWIDSETRQVGARSKEHL